METQSFDVSIFAHCDGSCRFIEEGTFVISTVVGPVHMSEKHQSHDPERGALELRCQLAERGAPDRALVERRIEEYVSSALKETVDWSKFPRQLVVVSILVVLDDGAALRLALNSTVLALIDATVPLSIIPLTVYCTDASKKAGALVTFDAGSQDILAFESTGVLSLDDLDTCFSVADGQCARLLEFVQNGADSQNGRVIPLYDTHPDLAKVIKVIEAREDVQEFLKKVEQSEIDETRAKMQAMVDAADAAAAPRPAPDDGDEGPVPMDTAESTS